VDVTTGEYFGRLREKHGNNTKLPCTEYSPLSVLMKGEKYTKKIKTLIN
jgi:hypothetical protein